MLDIEKDGTRDQIWENQILDTSSKNWAVKGLDVLWYVLKTLANSMDYYELNLTGNLLNPSERTWLIILQGLGWKFLS